MTPGSEAGQPRQPKDEKNEKPKRRLQHAGEDIRHSVIISLPDNFSLIFQIKNLPQNILGAPIGEVRAQKMTKMQILLLDAPGPTWPPLCNSPCAKLTQGSLCLGIADRGAYCGLAYLEPQTKESQKG